MLNRLLLKVLAGVALCSCSQQARTGTVAGASEPQGSKPRAEGTQRLYTPNPEIPATVTLWGEEIDLDRTDFYERFDRELTAMTYTHGNTLLTIKRANRVFPVIEPILRKNGIPSDMVYLAAIESNLDPLALSPAKAAGIWQFMPATARQYGLEVNDDVDERYNLEKATQAACRYFKEAYAKYRDWNSVAAAYNAGMARISRELAAQKQAGALDLYLVTETTRYPFRIMAMKKIMENPSDYGFHLTADQLYQPGEYETVNVSTPVQNWVDWAHRRGISYAQLREANPWIRSTSLPNKSGKTYKVLVPSQKSLKRSTQKHSVHNPAWAPQ